MLGVKNLNQKGLPMSIFPDKPIDSIEQDEFKNQDFAKTIVNIIENSSEEGHVNIALFGPWGTGKSSIGQIVGKEVVEKGYHFVHINVWKYAMEKGALVRKFLLEASNAIGSPTDELIEDLYVSKTTNELNVKSWWNTFVMFQLKITLPLLVFSIFLIFLLGNILGDYENIKTAIKDTFPNIVIATFLSVFSSIIVTFFSQLLKMSDVRIQKIDNPISSEEQYEKKFVDLIDSLDDKRVIFFIDDMDRLTLSKVMEVLETIKTFVEHEKCIFIVACEERILQQAIKHSLATNKEENKKDENSAEYLDKIFQVTLHIPFLYETDLLNYADSLIGKKMKSTPFCDLSDSQLDDVKIALIHNHVTTPRQVKVQLNDFSAVYQIAKDRNLKYVTSNPGFLAKLIAIRNDWSSFYEKLQKDSHLLEEIYKEINYGLGNFDKDTYNKKYGLSKSEFEKFYSYLIRTRNITVSNGIEAFLFLKDTPSSNEKVGGYDIREELVQTLHDGNGKKLIQLSQNWHDNQIEVVQFIFDKIIVASPTLRNNARIGFSFVLPYLKDNTIRSFIHKINSEILDPIIFENLKNEYSIEGIFKLIPFINETSIKEIVNAYSEEWNILDEPQKSTCMLRYVRYMGDSEREYIFTVIKKSLGIDDEIDLNKDGIELFYQILSQLDNKDLAPYKNFIWNMFNSIIATVHAQEIEESEEILILTENFFKVYWEKVSTDIEQWTNFLELLDRCEKAHTQVIFQSGIENSINHLNDYELLDIIIPKLLQPNLFKKMSTKIQQKLLDKIFNLPEQLLLKEKLGHHILKSYIYFLCEPETTNQANDIYNKKYKTINKLEIENFNDVIEPYIQFDFFSTELELIKFILDIIKDLGIKFDRRSISKIMVQQMNDLGKIEGLIEEEERKVKQIVVILSKLLVEIINNNEALAKEIYESWDINNLINYNISDEIAINAIKIRINFKAGRILNPGPIISAMKFSEEGFILGLEYFNKFFNLLINKKMYNSLLKQWVLSYVKWRDNSNAKRIDKLSSSLSKKFTNMKKLGRELLSRIPMQQKEIDELLKHIGSQADKHGARKRLYSDIKNELRANVDIEKLQVSLNVLIKIKEGNYSDHETIIFENFINWLTDTKIKNQQFILLLSTFYDFYENKDQLPYGNLGKLDNTINNILQNTNRIKDEKIINLLLKISDKHERSHMSKKISKKLVA